MSTPVRPAEEVPRSVERVLDVLEVVLADAGCTLTAAAAKAELTPTTTLRYLRALEARGYVDRDDAGRFHPGATMVRIAAAVRDGGPLERLITAARPHLDELARRSGESVYLVVSDGRRATYVATAESTRAIRHVGWVGQNVPLEGTAAGAAFSEPGSVVVRTGAVEPDITAISVSLEHVSNPAVAVSVVGPAARLDGDGEKSAITHLAHCVDALRATLDVPIEQEAAS